MASFKSLEERLGVIEYIWFKDERPDNNPVDLLLEYFQRAKLYSFKNDQQDEADLVVKRGLELFPGLTSDELIRVVRKYIKKNGSVTNSDNIIFGVQREIDPDFAQKTRANLLARLVEKLKDESIGAHSFIRKWSRVRDVFELIKYPKRLITTTLIEEGLYSHLRTKVAKARKYDDLLAFMDAASFANVEPKVIANAWAECGGIPAFKSRCVGATIPVTAVIYLHEILGNRAHDKFKRWDDNIETTAELIDELTLLSEEGLGVIGLRPEDFRLAALNRILQFGQHDGYFNHIHAFTMIMLACIFSTAEDRLWQNFALRVQSKISTLSKGWYRAEEDGLLGWMNERLFLLPKFK